MGVEAIANTEQPTAEQEKKHTQLYQVLNAVVPVAVFAFLAFNFVQTAYRARHDPWDMAFVVFAYAVLLLLVLCLKRIEQLSPASPAEQRWRLNFAAWALSAVLTCTFAYRISRIMPVGLSVVIWGMTASVMVVGFYGLFLYEPHYCGLEDSDVNYDVSFNKLPANEKV